MENDNYNFYVYIFPEDTLEGRQSYMSSFEVFFTPTQTTHYLSGEEQQKVEVLSSIEDYVNKKYFNSEKSERPLYFYRQTYLIEGNRFEPQILPTICYCHQIFNPDIPFKKCSCGSYFHPDCLLQSKSKKCWADNCDLLLNEEDNDNDNDSDSDNRKRKDIDKGNKDKVDIENEERNELKD